MRPTERSPPSPPAEYHTCGLRTDATITCWGYNRSGQVDAPDGTFTAVTAGVSTRAGSEPTPPSPAGAGTAKGRSTRPTERSPPSPPAIHTCGLRTDATITCWGTTSTRPTERSPPSPPAGVQHVRAQNRRHHHLLGQEPLRAGRRARRNVHRRQPRQVAHVRAQNRRHHHLLGLQQLRAGRRARRNVRSCGRDRADGHCCQGRSRPNRDRP